MAPTFLFLIILSLTAVRPVSPNLSTQAAKKSAKQHRRHHFKIRNFVFQGATDEKAGEL